MTRAETKANWQEHIRRWRRSGLTQRLYCDQSGISYWNFKTWAGKLKIDGTKETGQLIRVEVKPAEVAACMRIEICCGHQIRFFLDAATDPIQLARIIAALEKRHD